MKKKHRTPRPKTAPRGRSIETRPTEVATRNVFGHWEFDTVIGSKTKGETLLCFTERKTRFEIIFKAKDKSAASTVTVFNKLEKAFGRDFHEVFKSMTCDNGTEFSDTAALERSIYRRRSPRTTVYYCHPYTSSERGSNENQNAFIRRFIPKGTSMKHYTDEQIRAIQDYINAYPRALLNGKSSQELFENELSSLGIKNFFKNFYDIT